MKMLLFILLIALTVFGHTNLEKMSLGSATQVLKLMDEIERTNNDTLKLTFKELTNMDYNISLRENVYDIIHKNANHTSVFMKMAGLITFQNVIIVCMIFVSIAFLMFLCKDIIVYLITLNLTQVIIQMLVRFILNKKLMYGLATLASIVLMYINPNTIENKFLRYMFIFDWLSPLFGAFLFGIMSFLIHKDFIKTEKTETKYNRFKGGYSNDKAYVGLFVTLVWFFTTVYHQNWLIGIATVLMLFFSAGFLFGPIFGGYAVGYNSEESLIRCFAISVILNLIMIAMRCEFITGPIVEHTLVFESGVYFWGSIVGCLAMLVTTTFRTDITKILLIQIGMCIYSFLMLYLGSILYISSYKSIGGTFLVLWSLDIEHVLLNKLKSGNKTILLAIVLANLYVIKQLISWYPEYCIF